MSFGQKDINKAVNNTTFIDDEKEYISKDKMTNFSARDNDTELYINIGIKIHQYVKYCIENN